MSEPPQILIMQHPKIEGFSIQGFQTWSSDRYCCSTRLLLSSTVGKGQKQMELKWETYCRLCELARKISDGSERARARKIAELLNQDAHLFHPSRGTKWSEGVVSDHLERIRKGDLGAVEESESPIWISGSVPRGFWRNPGNRLAYMNWLGKRLGYEKPEDW